MGPISSARINGELRPLAIRLFIVDGAPQSAIANPRRLSDPVAAAGAPNSEPGARGRLLSAVMIGVASGAILVPLNSTMLVHTHLTLGLICMLFVVRVPARAQQRGTAGIYGRVVDSQGAVVPGANVTITNAATGGTQSMVTTSNGQFAFQDLPLGTYKVSVTASGFTPIGVDNVPVTAGASTSHGEAT